MAPNDFTSHAYKAIEQLTQIRQELKGNKQLLQSVFNTSLMAMAVLHSVRDTAGNIQDFVINMVNKQLERETGRTNLTGKLFSHQYPGMVKAGLHQLMVKVMETGKPEQTEYHYTHDNINQWFLCMLVRVDDGVVLTQLDITSRKQAEQEKLHNLTTLQRAEEISQMGIWEYSLLTGQFTWSEGMYRLLGLVSGAEAEPGHFLQHKTQKPWSISEHITDCLQTKTTTIEETLEVWVKGTPKIVKLKATVLYNEHHEPQKVMGVVIDITAQTKLQEKHRELEASHQQKIFWATLTAQETERKRIAESLHNGLGQLLYGAKLSLDQWDIDKPNEPPEKLKEIKATVNRLLTAAIEESRSIAHELTPAVLENFGLKTAITHICEQFNQKLCISCKFTGFYHKLSKPIELAIYRTIQELVLNIIKHSQATAASVRIDIDKAAVKLNVQDNGVGFDNRNKSNGIGLKTIQNKVKLLNGKFNLKHAPGENSIISISIPYEAE